MLKLTVLMPVYNGEQYLSEAIDSILSQDFQDFEFLIIDDGSTDRSESIVASYFDKRIRYVKRNENRGIVSTLNEGMMLAKGEYVARMDQDDVSLPCRFSRQILFLDQNIDVAVCAGLYTLIGNDSMKSYWPEDYKKVFTALSYFNCIGDSTVMMRRRFYEDHSLHYDKKFEFAEDYALWVRIASIGKISVLPLLLMSYRVHARGISQIKVVEQRFLSDRVRVMWFKTILGRELTEDEFLYFTSSNYTRKILNSAYEMFFQIVSTNTIYPLDKVFFGELFGKSLVSKTFDSFPYFGVYKYIFCCRIRRWSGVKFIDIFILFIRAIRRQL